MTSKTNTKTVRAKKTANRKQDKQSQSEHYAKVSLSAHCMSAALSHSFTKKLFPESDLGDAVNCLKDKISDSP